MSAIDSATVDQQLALQTPVDLSQPGTVGDRYKVQQPALWESGGPSVNTNRNWTTHAMSQVDQFGEHLLSGPQDVTEFCPNYLKLDRNHRLNFWAYFISTMVKFESGFKPASRYQETTMGTDAVTGEPVWSEGLLQLSYQDIRGYPFCEFDWSVDRDLPRNDPRKTILDPLKNLSCGIRILNQQVKREGNLVVARGAYWAVLKSNSQNNKIAQIKALNLAIPFCQVQ